MKIKARKVYMRKATAQRTKVARLYQSSTVADSPIGFLLIVVSKASYTTDFDIKVKRDHHGRQRRRKLSSPLDTTIVFSSYRIRQTFVNICVGAGQRIYSDPALKMAAWEEKSFLPGLCLAKAGSSLLMWTRFLGTWSKQEKLIPSAIAQERMLRYTDFRLNSFAIQDLPADIILAACLNRICYRKQGILKESSSRHLAYWKGCQWVYWSPSAQVQDAFMSSWTVLQGSLMWSSHSQLLLAVPVEGERHTLTCRACSWTCVKIARSMKAGCKALDFIISAGCDSRRWGLGEGMGCLA